MTDTRQPPRTAAYICQWSGAWYYNASGGPTDWGGRDTPGHDGEGRDGERVPAMTKREPAMMGEPAMMEKEKNRGRPAGLKPDAAATVVS